MIFEEIKSIKSGKKELREFGLTIGAVLVLFGMLLLWKGKNSPLYFFIFSGVFLLLGLSAPNLLRPVHKAWMILAMFLGWFMTRVILGILFFFVVTPIGLLARLSGKDFLNTGYSGDKGSYWITKNKVTFKKENYERQF